MNNPSAHPSYSHYYLLSPSTLFFLFLYILLFFARLVVFLHILLFFAHLIVLHFFYFIAHFTLISPFLTICMPCVLCTLYNLYSVLFCTVHWADLIRLHFTSNYTLYNYYVTNKETLNLEPWNVTSSLSQGLFKEMKRNTDHIRVQQTKLLSSTKKYNFSYILIYFLSFSVTISFFLCHHLTSYS